MLSRLILTIATTATLAAALELAPLAPHDASWTAPAVSGTETAHNMYRADFGNRTFWGYVPSNYTGAAAVPLVFAFHGLGDDCHRFGHETGMVAKAEAENFILAYPCGTAVRSKHIPLPPRAASPD